MPKTGQGSKNNILTMLEHNLQALIILEVNVQVSDNADTCTGSHIIMSNCKDPSTVRLCITGNSILFYSILFLNHVSLVLALPSGMT